MSPEGIDRTDIAMVTQDYCALNETHDPRVVCCCCNQVGVLALGDCLDLLILLVAESLSGLDDTLLALGQSCAGGIELRI